jgi:hypothetical protein
MAFRIPRFDRTIPLVHKEGLPTIVFHQWWNSVAKSIEVAITGIQDALAAAGIALGAAAAAQAAADAAQIAADNAQVAADAIVIPPTGSITVTNNYTIDPDTDHTILGDASGGNITITLPLAAISQGPFVVKKIDGSANVVFIQRTNPDQINGGVNIGLTTQYETSNLGSDGINDWYG